MSLKPLTGHELEVIRLYEIEKWTGPEIASAYGVSRQAVWKCLQDCAVDTRKSVAGWVDVVCDHCGIRFRRRRKQARRSRNHFCSYDHYGRWMKGENP